MLALIGIKSMHPNGQVAEAVALYIGQDEDARRAAMASAPGGFQALVTGVVSGLAWHPAPSGERGIENFDAHALPMRNCEESAEFRAHLDRLAAAAGRVPELEEAMKEVSAALLAAQQENGRMAGEIANFKAAHPGLFSDSVVEPSVPPVPASPETGKKGKKS